MNTRKAGKDYEDAAEDYLKSKGYRTLEKNYHCRYGEIDLIVRSEEGAVVFVEVKGRSKGNWGDPAEDVTPLKQKNDKSWSFRLLFFMLFLGNFE